jgi:hypothetical protein
MNHGKRSLLRIGKLLLVVALPWASLGCHPPDHVFSVVGGPQLDGAVVRVDGTQLGLLAPDPYVDVWPLNQFSALADTNWATIRRDVAKVPLRPGPEHLLEILPPHGGGPTYSLGFTVPDRAEPRFINFGFNRDGTLACIVYHRDGSMTSFPGGATQR